MSRYNVAVESVAALAAGTVFANIDASANVGFKLRRVTLGVRAGSGAPTSQQLTVAITRATARGTATTTLTGQKMDPNSNASQIMGVDTVWSGNPTLAGTPSYEVSFNTQSGVDLPWEMLEEFVCAAGTANGIAFENIGNALPASHLLTLGVEWEE